jgi:soluble lytic murein transglycosylase-like protein
MSVGEVTGRIAQIQSQLANLSAPAKAGGSGSGFSSVLGAAQAGLEGDLATGGVESLAGGAGSVVGAPGTPAVSAGVAMPGAGLAISGGGGPADGQAVVDAARKYLGVPYVWGGTDPAKGLDCSGLVQLVYKQFGIDLPRVSYQQATAGRPVASLAQARPGDILAFDNPVDHVAIYAGNGKMIEAPRTGLDVRVTDVYETPTAIRRVLPDQPVAAPGVTRSAVAGSALPAGTPYASLFTQAAQRHGISPTLLAAVAQQESGFDARAVSPAGAQGLMQLMPSTAAGLGVRNAFDPAQAVDGAARLLKNLVGEFGRVDLALAAYNAGPGAVHRYGGIPPYPETRRYVPAVLAHKAALERA